MPDSYLRSLLCPLPEDIAHLKGAGEYDLAIRLIDRRLQKDLPQMLRTRLETERIFLTRLPRDYTLTGAALCEEIRQSVPDFRDEELDALLVDGYLDFIYLNGERRYHEDTASSLMKNNHALNLRAVKPYDESKCALEAVIARVMAGESEFTYRMRATLHIREHAFEAGATYRVHLPVPALSMQQSAAFDIVCSEPIASIDDENAPQRTAYIARVMDENAPLILEYSYTQRPRYVNPLDEGRREILYPAARPVCADDLAQNVPHIAFTPYLVALAKELRGDERDPVRTARAFYDYVTTRINYAYQRPYLLIEGGAEYTAVNGFADCGLQALLFITLCRISGIPARWQSGLYAAPKDVGSHDWAEFYSERLGWLPVDCSFGGTAWRANALTRWHFYFGNLDPWRMVANRAYYAPMSPEKRFARFDPYDSQRGEVETLSHGLYGGDFYTRYQMLINEGNAL